MTTERPSCDDYMRMPLSEAVIEHIKACEKCRAIVSALADDLDRHAYEFEHRN
jgi:predicted anti-sigma-YlaC factor YlaD